jgi:transcriptional regulator with XRE-family HTH domain
MEKPLSKKEAITEEHVRLLVSSNMRRLRALRGMSQIELARITGLTHNFISDIENCKKGISDKSIAKISVTFGVEPYQLFMPEYLANDVVRAYVHEFNDSILKAVQELSKRFLPESPPSET